MYMLCTIWLCTIWLYYITMYLCYADHIRTQRGSLGTNSSVFLLKFCSSVSHTARPHHLYQRVYRLSDRERFSYGAKWPPFLAVRLYIKYPHLYSGKFVWGEFYIFCMKLHDVLFSYSTVDEFLPAFIGCLESHDYNIVMAAVGSIPDLVLLCKGTFLFLSLKQTLQLQLMEVSLFFLHMYPCTQLKTHALFWSSCSC